MRAIVKSVGLTLVLTSGMLAGGRARADTASACTALATLRIEDTNLLSATVVPAKDGLPAYCRVLGFVRPAINFEVRLPTAGWNGKFYMAGCGGFCGKLDSDRPGPINAMNHGLRRHYAVSTMDGGHWGATGTDGRWAYHNRLAEVDFGYRAGTETARVTKVMIQAFYGVEQKKSYFNGCSNGGRMALMEAWRYPNDFDGIISGAPGLDMSGLAAFWAWVVQANTGPDGQAILPRAKVKLVQEAVLRACDAKDGRADGLIDDPRACDFKPASLTCPKASSTACLTEAEVAVLEKWYGGARNARGEALYPGGIPLGSEPYWWRWLTGDEEGRGPALPAFAVSYLRYLAFPDDPGDRYGPTQFDFEQDPPRLQAMGDIYNATNPNLSLFKARGGKLLMWHSWADAVDPPERTVRYYTEVEERMGGRAATQEFLRLFMVPAMDHCGNLPGPGITAAGFDPLTALEQWVEEGVPPTRLLATKTDKDGKAVWTRPLCPYPQAATYQGTGDPHDAASFHCTEP
jgi:Tannase and feruloyl esterase